MKALGPLGEREATAAAGNFKTAFDLSEAGAVAELVGHIPVESLGRSRDVLQANLGSDLEDPCGVTVLVNDVDGFDLVRHKASPSPAYMSQLDAALVRVRNYATQNQLTPDQVLDCFLAGVQASRVFGAGEVAPSVGWQSADLVADAAAGEGG